MTGFARASAEALGRTATWEVRSVNGRGLDVRLRTPPGFDRLENEIRARTARRFDRGNVSLNLTLETPASAPRLQINRAALDQVIALIGELSGRLDAAAPRLDGLLGVRGVIETVAETPLADDEQAKIDAAILSSLDKALDGLATARRDEGRALLAILDATLAEIAALTAEAAANAATQPAALKARLESQIAELLGAQHAIAPDRLAHEAALLAVKADVREELDRLRAHIGQARELFAKGGAVGRKLDFLSQEFNREANTLCSKSSDTALTRIGLALKTAIDRLREQAANVE
ncbi:MAG: YicC family protein [Rhodospirillales bacterium]|nr:YicC family protein [Rhodospirillales bacterium]